MAAGIVTEQLLPVVPQRIPALAIVPPDGLVIVRVKGGPVVPVPVPVPVPDDEDPPEPEDEDPLDPDEDDAVKVATHVRGPWSASAKLAFVPEQLPDQPENTYPAPGVASSPRVIGPGIVTEHAIPLVPQLIPALLTVPPDGRVIVSV
jgi:hypothetical protein